MTNRLLYALLYMVALITFLASLTMMLIDAPLAVAITYVVSNIAANIFAQKLKESR